MTYVVCFALSSITTLVLSIFDRLDCLQAEAWRHVRSEMVAVHLRKLESLKTAPAPSKATVNSIETALETSAPSLFDMELDEDDDNLDDFLSGVGVATGTADCDKVIMDAMIDSEKQTYMQLAATGLKINPLETWKQWSKGMPLLGEVARKWLAVPASSASSERVFSSAGLTISKKRTKLGAERAATLVFLKTAWPTLQKSGVLYDGSGPSAQLNRVLNAADSDTDGDAET